jgi:hypothetical protein
MSRFLYSIAIIYLMLLVGCDKATLMKKWTPPEDEAAARGYVDLLRHQKFDQIEGSLDRSISGPSMRDTLSTMAGMFPAQEPMSIKVVGATVLRSTDSTTTSITVEYEFPDNEWVLANVVMKKSAGITSIVGFHVKPTSDSQEYLNRFTFTGKGSSQYIFLLLSLLSIAFSVYVCVLCAGTKIRKGKWLWLIATLIGVGRFGVDWTTGQVFMNPIWVQIPPAGASAPLYGAWFVYTALPLGAILFLSFRKDIGPSETEPRTASLQTPPQPSE